MTAADEDTPLSDWKYKELRAHRRKVTCLDWSADGKRLATGAQDGTLKLWRIDEACGSRYETETSFSADALTRVSYHPTSPDRLASISEHDGNIRFWDMRSGRNTVGLETPGVNCTLSWSSDAQYIAVTSTDYQVTVLDARRMRVLVKVPPRSQVADAVFARGDAQLLQVTVDGTVECANVVDGRVTRSRRGHMAAATALAQDARAGNRLLATGGDDAVACLWEADDLIGVQTFLRSDAPITALGFSAAARYLAIAAADGTLDVENLGSGAYLGRVAMRAPPRVCAWNPRHTMLAVPGDLARDGMGVEYGSVQLRAL